MNELQLVSRVLARYAAESKTASLKDDFSKRILEELEKDENLENALEWVNITQRRYGNEEYRDIAELKKYDMDTYKSLLKQLLVTITSKLGRISFGSKGILVYRALSVQDPLEFIEKLQSGSMGIGIYWSFDRRKAKTYWGRSDLKTVILRGELPLESVDYKETVKANTTTAFSQDEDEITAIKGAKVYIEAVSLGDTETEIGKQVRIS